MNATSISRNRQIALLTFTAAALLGALAPPVAEAKECRNDAECGADFHCAKSCGTAGCSTPPNCPPQGVMCSETGTCEPKYRACAAPGDCPGGLACEPGPNGACSRSSTGETMCTDAPKVCTFVQPTCNAGADCGAGFECVTSTSTGCPAIYMAGAPPCAPTEVKTCEPKRVTCRTDGDCAAGSVCFDFATSRVGTPSHWGEGDARSCVSAGLAFALRGHAAVKGSGFAGGGTPESRTGSGTPTLATGNGSAPVDDAAAAAADGDGCSFGGGGSAAGWGLLVSAVAVAFARRRRAR